MTATHTRRAAVGVDELKRAWLAVQDGRFRSGHCAPSTEWADLRGAGEHPGGGVWEPAEPVLSVIGCAGSVGASTLALALATAAGSGRVVECCTVTASGLAAASTAELGRDETGWVQGTRERVLIERGSDAMVRPGEVPLPTTPARPVTLTVLDVGWELGQLLAAPGWLGDQLLHAPVVAVTTATVPGLRRLEGALALLEVAGVVAAVIGPRRRKWSRGVEHSMGALSRSLDHAGRLVEVPQDRDLAVRGLDSTPLPPPLLSAADHLLRLTGAGSTTRGNPS